MSVIPFHNSDESSNFTESQLHFSVQGLLVLIQNLDRSQFSVDAKDGNATYNLRIGTEYRSYLDSGATRLSRNEKIFIRSGASAVVQTLEYVHFPATRYGLILPRVSLLQRGLSTVASKVDPGYKGHLAITIFNHSRETQALDQDEQFCSLTILSVENYCKPYDKPPKTLAADRKNYKKKINDWYSRLAVPIGYLGFLIGLLAFTTRATDIVNSVVNWIESFGLF